MCFEVTGRVDVSAAGMPWKLFVTGEHVRERMIVRRPGIWGTMSGEAMDNNSSGEGSGVPQPSKLASEASLSGSSSGWGTCAELLLVSAVKKHGVPNWNLVAKELKVRAELLKTSPSCFSEEACKFKYNILKSKFGRTTHGVSLEDDLDGVSWFEELRKLRMSHLKDELQEYDSSIIQLQSQISLLREERAKSPSLQPLVKQPETIGVDLCSTGSKSLDVKSPVATRVSFEAPEISRESGMKGSSLVEIAPREVSEVVLDSGLPSILSEETHFSREDFTATPIAILPVKPETDEVERTTPDLTGDETKARPEKDELSDEMAKILVEPISMDDEAPEIVKQSIDESVYPSIPGQIPICEISCGDAIPPLTSDAGRDHSFEQPEHYKSVGPDMGVVAENSDGDIGGTTGVPPIVESTEATKPVDFRDERIGKISSEEAEPLQLPVSEANNCEVKSSEVEVTSRREARQFRLSLSYRRAQKDKRLKALNEIKVQPISPNPQVSERVDVESPKKTLEATEVVIIEDGKSSHVPVLLEHGGMGTAPVPVPPPLVENGVMGSGTAPIPLVENGVMGSGTAPIPLVENGGMGTESSVDDPPSSDSFGTGPVDQGVDPDFSSGVSEKVPEKVLEPTEPCDETTPMDTDFAPSEMDVLPENPDSLSGEVTEIDSLVCDTLSRLGTQSTPLRPVNDEIVVSESIRAVASPHVTSSPDTCRESAFPSAVLMDHEPTCDSQALLDEDIKSAVTNPASVMSTEIEASCEGRSQDTKIGTMEEAVRDCEQEAEPNLDLSGTNNGGEALMVDADPGISSSFAADPAEMVSVKECRSPQEESRDGLEVCEGQQPFPDSTDSQIDKSEVGSSMDSVEDMSPSSRKNRREPKVSGKLLPLLECLRVICAHKSAHLFKQRQEYQDSPEYDRVVRRHLDLGMVRTRLEEGAYSGSLEFFRDLLLIFTNALVYNNRDSQEYAAAKALRSIALTEMEKIMQTEALMKQNGPATRKREVRKSVEQKVEVAKAMEVLRSRVSSTSGSDSRKKGTLKGHHDGAGAAVLDLQAGGARSARIALEDTPQGGRSSNVKEENCDLDVRIGGTSTKKVPPHRSGKDETPRKELQKQEFLSEATKSGAAHVSAKKAQAKVKVDGTGQKKPSSQSKNVNVGTAGGVRKNVETTVGTKTAPTPAKVKDALYIDVERKGSVKTSSGGPSRLAAAKQQTNSILRQTSASRVSRYSKRAGEIISSNPKKRVRK